MTILPKRSNYKRRLDHRDRDQQHQDSSQQLAHNQQLQSSTLSTPLEIQTNHSVGQLQIESPLSLSHSLNHTHSHAHFSGHAHAAVGLLHQQQRQANTYNNTMIYNHRADNNTHGTRAQQAAVMAAEAKWRRSPPVRAGSSADDKYIPPHKKSKRSKAKSKHVGHHDYQKVKDNQSHLSPMTDQSTAGKFISVAGSSTPYPTYLSKPESKASQSRQILIPAASTNNASILQLSPKMPGGAQQKAGTGRSSKSPENGPNSEDEYQSPPSPGGCNSEDEHVPSMQAAHTEELEKTFEMALKKELGLVIRQMEMDGSCLFRAIADQVYGDQDMHDVVRSHCIDYMAKNVDHFSQYITEDFTTYLQRKRQLGCHGNHIEVQALSEMYNRPIEVYQYALKPMNIFHGSYRPESAFPIRLSYHRNTHYNSLIDPEKPTIGVGLGLSDFKPRTVEKNLVAEVETSSENYQIEQAMLKDKLMETDWEITDEAINEQVARESYTQWLEDCQKQKRRTPACTVTGPSCSSVTEETVNWMEKLSPTGSPGLAAAHSPQSEREKLTLSMGSGVGKKLDSACGGEEASSSSALNLSTESKTFLDLEPFTVYNYNDNIDEKEALARAIAESQQEYINHVLKK